MATKANAQISEGTKLLQKKEYHAAFAVLECVSQTYPMSSASERAQQYAKKALGHLSSDPYAALNISRRSNRATVKKSYRKLALKYHPDKNAHTSDLFKVINEAYDKLKDKPTPKKAQAFTQSSAATPPQKQHHRRRKHKQHESKTNASNKGYNTAFKKAAYERFVKQQQQERERQQDGRGHDYGPKSARASSGTSSAPKRSFFRPANERSYGSSTSSYGNPKPPPRQRASSTSWARNQPGFPERQGDAPKSARGEAEKWKNAKYPYSQKHNEKQRSKPTPTPDEETKADEYYRQAEEAMQNFWKTGVFPFEFAKNAPTAAAEMFAKMFQNQPSAQRQAFEKMFSDKFTGAGREHHQGGAWGASGSAKNNSSKTHQRRPAPTTEIPKHGMPTPRVTGLRIHEVSDVSVVLTWNTVVQGISAGLTDVLYELQFKEFSAAHWQVSSETIRTTTVRKKGLKPGKRYEFRVRARASRKEGAWSQTIASRTESGTPSAPHISKLIEVASTSVRIVWNEPECNGAAVRQYELQWRHSGSTFWQTASATLKGTDCRKKNLLPSRRYEFRIRAMNRVGWSEWSCSRICTTDARPISPKVVKEEKTESAPKEAHKDAEEKKPEPKNKPELKKANQPTEYYEMYDAGGNLYYWNELNGSSWTPPIWIDRYDENLNIYYEHTITGQSLWKKPNAFIPIIRNHDKSPDEFESYAEEEEGGKSPFEDIYSPASKAMMSAIYPEAQGRINRKSPNVSRVQSSPI